MLGLFDYLYFKNGYYTGKMDKNMIKEKLMKIENRSAKIGIVGLGYVGLPLAIEFINAGFLFTALILMIQKLNC